jgi:hypothetical protein
MIYSISCLAQNELRNRQYTKIITWPNSANNSQYSDSSSSPCNHGLFILFFSIALPAPPGPRHLIQFRNPFSGTIGLLWRMISRSQGCYLNTGQQKHTEHQCLKWDSNPRSLRPSERRQFLPSIARLLWPAGWFILGKCITGVKIVRRKIFELRDMKNHEN